MNENNALFRLQHNLSGYLIPTSWQFRDCHCLLELCKLWRTDRIVKHYCLKLKNVGCYPTCTLSGYLASYINYIYISYLIYKLY